MEKLLLFGEFIDTNNFLFFISEKLNILSEANGLGTYFQGLVIQNTVDFIWGTNSGIRSLPIASFLGLIKLIFGSNWYKYYEIITVVLPFICFLIAARLIKRIDLFIILGGLLYSLNHWILGRLITGFWQLNIVYSLLPFLIIIPYYLIKNQKRGIKFILFCSSIFSILISIILLSQPHFLIISSLFLTLHLLVNWKNKKDFKLLLNFYLLSFIFLIPLNLYIIAPSLIFPEKIFTAPNQYFSIGSVIFNGAGAQIENILRFSPLWHPIINKPWTLINYIQLLPIFITFAVFINTKSKNWLFLTCLLIYIFLAKGINDPLLELSRSAYTHIPLLHFFRDPSRLLAGVALFSSLIIAFYDRKIKSKIFSAIVIFGFFSILWISSSDLIYTEFNKYIRPTFIPIEYVQMQKFINNLNENENRILIIPNSHSLKSYNFYDNPSPIATGTIFEQAIPLNVPRADGTNYPDNYSNQFSAYIYNQFLKDYDTKILSPLSVKYILLDASVKNQLNENYLATTSAESLMSNTELTLVNKINDLYLFKLKNVSPISTNIKPIFAIGDFNTILNVKKINQNIPVILLNQNENLSKADPQLLKNEKLITDVENPELTLASESFLNSYSIDILNKVWDWDKNYVNCEPYKLRYIINSGNLFTSGRCVTSNNEKGEINIPLNLPANEYRVIAKLQSIDIPASFSIQIQDKKISKPTKANELDWVDLGKFNTTTEIKNIKIISNEGEGIIVDSLIIVPNDIFEEKINNIKSIISSMSKIKIENVNEIQTSYTFSVNTDRIKAESPTNYLTYRFTWGENWKTDVPSTNFMSEGYGMTFISKNLKISESTYFPNLVYKICLAISFFSYLSLIGYIFYFLFKQKIKKLS